MEIELLRCLDEGLSFQATHRETMPGSECLIHARHLVLQVPYTQGERAFTMFTQFIHDKHLH